MLIRRAKPDDAQAVIDIAVESVSRDPLPVKVDRVAMKETFMSALNPAHFAYVTEDDNGTIVAACVAVVQRGFWFEKMQLSVILYYSRVRNAGIGLLRELARFVKSRSGIKLAIIELEPGVDERLKSLFKRLGFARESTNLTYVRGAL